MSKGWAGLGASSKGCLCAHGLACNIDRVRCEDTEVKGKKRNVTGKEHETKTERKKIRICFYRIQFCKLS